MVICLKKNFSGDYPENLIDFTAKCLKKNPEDRLRLGGSHRFIEDNIPSDVAFLSFLEKSELL